MATILLPGTPPIWAAEYSIRLPRRCRSVWKMIYGPRPRRDAKDSAVSPRVSRHCTARVGAGGPHRLVGAEALRGLHRARPRLRPRRLHGRADERRGARESAVLHVEPPVHGRAAVPPAGAVGRAV